MCTERGVPLSVTVTSLEKWRGMLLRGWSTFVKSSRRTEKGIG
jgi:hypothetical protein